LRMCPAPVTYACRCIHSSERIRTSYAGRSPGQKTCAILIKVRYLHGQNRAQDIYAHLRTSILWLESSYGWSAYSLQSLVRLGHDEAQTPRSKLKRRVGDHISWLTTARRHGSVVIIPRLEKNGRSTKKANQTLTFKTRFGNWPFS
jgi:hypothetical protein